MLFSIFRFILGNKKLRVTLTAMALLFTVVAVSTIGIWHFEKAQNLSLMDCVWMTVVTMTTVGYGDLYPKTLEGRIFVIIIPMVLGIGTMAYLVTMIATTVIEKEAKIVNGQLDLNLEDHILIINLQHEQKVHALIDELRKNNKSSDVPIVLIDADKEVCPDRLLQRKNFYYIRGNPLWSVTLERANASKATQAVILAKDPAHTASDGITLQVAVVLKHMHKEENLPIALVAEVISEDSVEPLKLVGVEKVICLEEIIPPLIAGALRDKAQKEGIV